MAYRVNVYAKVNPPCPKLLKGTSLEQDYIKVTKREDSYNSKWFDSMVDAEDFLNELLDSNGWIESFRKNRPDKTDIVPAVGDRIIYKEVFDVNESKIIVSVWEMNDNKTYTVKDMSKILCSIKPIH